MGYKNSKVAIAKKMEDATLKVFNDFRELNLLKQGHDSLYFFTKGFTFTLDLVHEDKLLSH
jgi:hypothetical protein